MTEMRLISHIYMVYNCIFGRNVCFFRTVDGVLK